MDLISIQFWLLIAMLVIAAVLAIIVVKVLDRLRRKDAESTARAILAKAETEIDTRRKEAELELKELALQKKQNQPASKRSCLIVMVTDSTVE